MQGRRSYIKHTFSTFIFSNYAYSTLQYLNTLKDVCEGTEAKVELRCREKE